MTTNIIAKDIKENWSDIKSKVHRHWRKLSPKDLKDIEGSYTQLIKKVEEAYEITKEEATAKVHEYIEKLGLSEIEETVVTAESSIVEKAKNAKEVFEKSIKEKLANIKDTTENVQEDITEYVQTNPIKSVGLAVLAGLVTGKLWGIVK